jgi:predicted nucleotidyltransferase
LSAQIAVDRDQLADLCRRHGIRRLSLFGSVLRDDFRDDSDVDLLVRWRSDARPDAFSLFDVEKDFSELFGGRKVDLVNERFLYHRLRDRVLGSAEVVYDEG